jgi:hypothetical protein
MNMLERAAAAALTALWLFHISPVAAQESQAQAQTTGSTVGEQAAADIFPQDQVEQLVAPIALYPDALLAQQDDVTDAVQLLRRDAKAAGNLQTTEQQRVEVEPAAAGDAQAQVGGETIIIQPADPQVVYVPSYNPSTAYGQTEPLETTYYPATYTTPTTTYVSDSTSSDSSGLVSFGVGALAGGPAHRRHPVGRR